MEVLSTIKKRIKLILIMTILITLASGILVYYGTKPLYKASTSILLGKNGSEKITNSDVVLYQDLSKTYLEIAKSRRVTEITSEKLKDGTTASDIQNSILVDIAKDNQVVTIFSEAITAKSAANMANAFAEAFINECQSLLGSDNAQIIDNALVPENPVPISKIENIAITLLGALIFSILIALFIEYMNHTIKNVNDITKYSDIPIIGVIPKTKVSELIVEKKPESFASQAYRTLRTNIQFPSNNKNLNIILVTSAGVDEGKTTVAANLALTIAQSGKTVLLMDCDLRNPSLHKVFKVSNRKGLSDILSENLEIRKAVIYISERLDILTAGDLHNYPSELLASLKMSNFLKELQSKYNNIIIDSPAILSVTDAQVLATKVNGVVYVVGAQKCSIEAMKRSRELLKVINANVIGAVLNNTTHKSDSLNIYFRYKPKKPIKIKKIKKTDTNKILPKGVQIS